jgi:OPT oligopeptide transporter protein
MPISADVAFDNRGHIYNASAIITNGKFDLAKYESYSPLFLSTTEYMAIGLGLASFTSVIPHTYRKSSYLSLASDVYPQFQVWFRRDIARRFRMSLRDERDVHSHLMQAYPEVPRWWYASVGVTSC